MRFLFFISKDISSFIQNSYTSYIQKQVDNLPNYRALFLTGIITILLGAYSFIAYSFLETSSVLIEHKNYHNTQRKIGEITTNFNDKYAYRFLWESNLHKERCLHLNNKKHKIFC
ncbi:hypothetical protein ATO12_10960 [Aquimarina atlantica]|uniref:Uncharacterized protein n=1 Tax=Aquimarina atlantica TaxID=1317122 RepID=A0A023BMT0_9FLAO|nr:hypothetical protein [Aquimarina atlantica]EZH71301.1 hypothetical protein ATO12_10960 [Aquimarina atlantica]